MSVKLAYNRNEQFSNGVGVPFSGAKLFTYVGGSVNTKQTTFTESTGTTPNTNPIVLDSSGQLPQPVWLTTGLSYKFVLAPSTDTDPPSSPIWTLDGITGINDSSASQSEWIAGPTPTFVSTTQFTLVGDQTTNFAKSRRVKHTVTAGTVFGTITNSAFAALTTVTVALDSGNLDSGLSAVSFGIVSAANPSINADLINRKGTAVASAATTDIWSIAGDFVHITGNTGPITSFGTAPYAGAQRVVIFDSTPTITQNATTLQLPGGVSRVASAGDRAIVRADTTANMIVVDYIPATGIPLTQTGVTHGQCRLTKSGANLLLSPSSGNGLLVNSVLQAIPDAGVTLGVGGLAASTTYFIYAFMNASVMTLEAVVTGHSTQAGTGVEIKTGDATRTLVGMGRTNGSTAWEDDASLVGVLSYFNRRNKGVTTAVGGTGTASVSVVELSSGIRFNFLVWADESVIANGHGAVNNNSGATTTNIYLAADSTSATDVATLWNTSGPAGAGSLFVPWALGYHKASLSEGFHFITINANVSGGSASISDTTLSGTTRG